MFRALAKIVNVGHFWILRLILRQEVAFEVDSMKTCENSRSKFEILPLRIFIFICLPAEAKLKQIKKPRFHLENRVFIYRLGSRRRSKSGKLKNKPPNSLTNLQNHPKSQLFKKKFIFLR